MTDRKSAADLLYDALAHFDTRNGSFDAAIARAAREGYERSEDEPDAWAELESLLALRRYQFQLRDGEAR